MSSFRFLHAADIHLDSPLNGLSRYDGVPVEEVRGATRRALTNLVERAIEERVSFIVIAGDLYDGDWKDFSTGIFFCGLMGQLKDAGIEVYLLYGNHDAQSVITRRMPLPPNVHVFSAGRAETLHHEPTGAFLHGQSYRRAEQTEDLAAGYPPRQPGGFNIGVLHTALEGRAHHATYAPCSTASLSAKGYDYWALGHVHQFEEVSANPRIVFPGNLQGRSARETGPKGAVMVTVTDNVVASVEHVAVDAVRWAVCRIDVAGLAQDTAIEAKVSSAIAAIFEREAKGRPLMLRLVLEGETVLHGTLADRRLTLREEVRGIASAVSREIWLEKVQLRTRPLVMESPTPFADADEIWSFLETGKRDASLSALLEADYADLISKLPAELAAGSELVSAAKAGDFQELLEEATETLKSRLGGAAG